MNEAKLSLLIPTEYDKDIFSIDYNSLFDSGKRLILIDLDNTIADYETPNASEEVKLLFRQIKDLGFVIVIITNNSVKRVLKFGDDLEVDTIHRLAKPMTYKICKQLKKHSFKKEEIVWIGDQIMTDIKCANRLKISSILVDPIKPQTEHWYTLINRKIEKKALLAIKNKKREIFDSLGLEKRL